MATGKRSTESNIQSYHVGQSVTLTRGEFTTRGIVANLTPDSMGGFYSVMAISGRLYDATDSELSLN